MTPPSFHLLVTGINWPPEAFLMRLIDGLIQAGIQVTIGSAQPPLELRGRASWLQTPSWETPLFVRIIRLIRMVARATIAGPADLRVLHALSVRSNRWPNEVHKWFRLLPYVGRRWDIIYFPWNSTAIGALPVFGMKTPVVVSCRGSQVSVAPQNPARSYLREGLKQIFEKAAAVHCVAQATMQDACKLGLNPQKARIIRPAIDLNEFAPHPLPGTSASAFSVLAVGTLIWMKGYEWALRAIRLLLDGGVNVNFDIIGDGPDHQRVLYTISDLGLNGRVRLLGRIPPREVLHHVQRADAFLLASLSEGISNAVLEAMACGIPVVTTDCGGMREAVTDGVEGFVVPLRNSEAMANSLETLVRNVGLRKRMGKAARGRVERDFDLSRQIEQWLDFYQSVLDRRERVHRQGNWTDRSRAEQRSR